MPSFTITVASNSITLDATGNAQASFTVTNTTPQPIQGRLLAEAEGSAQPEWLSIIGAPAREFPASGAEQVDIQVAVPQPSPPGSYAFRLDAVAEANPDEDFTKGPSVAFEIAAQPKPKKKFPWWIVVIAVIVIAGIGVAVWLVTKSSTKTATAIVPDVTSQPADQAQTTLLNDGFTVRRYNAIRFPIGLVIQETPTGGSMEPQGSIVNITVSVPPSIAVATLHKVTMLSP